MNNAKSKPKEPVKRTDPLNIDIEMIKFHKWNLDWSVKLLEQTDILKITGNKDTWGLTDLESETIIVSREVPEPWRLWLVFDQYFKLCFQVNVGSKDHLNDQIDHELEPSLLAEGMCDLINKGMLKLSNGKNLDGLKFNLNAVKWTVLLKPPEEIRDKDDRARSMVRILDGEVWINNESNPKTRVFDFFHELCHVAMTPYKLSAPGNGENTVDPEILRGLAAMGIIELLKQGVIKFNDKYYKNREV